MKKVNDRKWEINLTKNLLYCMKQEEKKAREAEAKRKRLEEAEKKRQAMMEAMEKQKQVAKPNFVISKKDAAPQAAPSFDKVCFNKHLFPFSHNERILQFQNVMYARSEMNKTKEQLAEDKEIALQFRIKPLDIEGCNVPDLKKKAQALWEQIVQLESDKYDLEERQKRQDYDVSACFGMTFLKTSIRFYFYSNILVPPQCIF